MRLLDLFCGAGGAAMGYHRAGFTSIVGVDIKPQPNYPFDFIQADAMGPWDTEKLGLFDAIHASPPCQRYTKAKKLQGNDHPDLVGPVRDLLDEIGLPYVIENVVGAPLRNPMLLCGTMFGLMTYRHRLFEANWPLPFPLHHPHGKRQVKMGRPVEEGDYIQIVGHFSGAEYARKAMETPWMTKDEMAEAIPPAYTEFIGKHLMEQVEVAA